MSDSYSKNDMLLVIKFFTKKAINKLNIDHNEPFDYKMLYDFFVESNGGVKLRLSFVEFEKIMLECETLTLTRDNVPNFDSIRAIFGDTLQANENK